MSNKNELNLENKIMEKVLSGSVNMKPRWYFILGSILSFVGLVGFIIGSIFLTNLTLFLIRKQGPGTGRLIQMLESFPLWIPFLAIVFIVLGILFLKKYDFSYKKNFIVLIIIFIISVLVASMLIDLLGFNEIWLKRGPMKGFYQQDSVYNVNKPRYPKYIN